MFRETVSLTFTLCAVWVVVSLVWYLIEERKNKVDGATYLAAATIMFFVGLLSSQLYTLLNMRWIADGHGTINELSPFWPIAVVTMVLVFGGVVWKVWLYRPRATLWLWFSIIAASGVAVVIARLIIF